MTAPVLAIRLGALGDLFLSFPAFAAIRAHHAADELALLTTAPFAALMGGSPWFDRVLLDPRPHRLDPVGRSRLARTLRPHRLVYDLQTSARSSSYFPLAGRPPWSGIARGCAFPDADPGRDALHTVDRQSGQLRQAGIAAFPQPSLDWLRAGPPPVPLPHSTAVLVPSAAPHRPAKRWPADRFHALAASLAADGLAPVIVGAAGDRALADAILDGVAGGVNLAGRTDLAALARVMDRAVVAIGNDTGPMHVAATLGCPTVVLFGGESDPALTAPRGPAPVRILRRPLLASLPLADVRAAVRAVAPGGASP